MATSRHMCSRIVNNRLAGVCVVGMLLGALVYELRSHFSAAFGGASGADGAQKSWDPTGSHPLPNEGVERAP